MAKKITIIIEDDGTAQGLSNIQDFSIPETSGYGWNGRRGYVNPCEHCNNNPVNNPYASGFCNCALPALANPMF